MGGQGFKGFGGGGMPKNDMASKEEEENIWCVKEEGSTCPGGGEHMSGGEHMTCALKGAHVPRPLYFTTCMYPKAILPHHMSTWEIEQQL